MTQQFLSSLVSQRRSLIMKRKSTNSQYTIGNYQLGKKIGNGAYGTVYEAYKQSTREKYAVKILSFNDINYQTVKYESKICQQVFHENIARVYNVIQTDNKIYIFMQFCQNGELFDYIKSNGPLNQQLTARIFLQLYSAVKYLHFKKIAHRDIKSQNVLLDSNLNPKLIDFGLSKQYTTTNPMMETFCGSPSYVAPEIIKKQKYNGEKIDVWSLGVTLYIMLEASQPFYSKNPSQTKIKILNLQWLHPQHSSKQAIQLYEQIFVPANNRISITQMQNTSFFQKHTPKRLRYQSHSTQKTQRISTMDGFQLVLPEIINPRKKQGLKKYLDLQIIQQKYKQNPQNDKKYLYNSIIYRQDNKQLKIKGRSSQLKNIKYDWKINKQSPNKFKKFFKDNKNDISWFHRDTISNLNNY